MRDQQTTLHQHFDHRIQNMCYITGYEDRYNQQGIVQKCHILQRELCSGKHEIVDEDNVIYLTSCLHRLFDSYMIWFQPETGQMFSCLSPEELKMLGIKDINNCYLPPGKMNAKTVSYFKRRPGTLNEYRMAVASIRSEKQEEEE